MAVTKIHPIETTLNTALNYVMNPEKTDEKLLISGYKCEPDFACMSFNMTKKEADKTGGILAYHTIQSFAPGEVDYATAHELGMRLGEQITGGNFEFIVATHVDKNHVHKSKNSRVILYQTFSKL